MELIEGPPLSGPSVFETSSPKSSSQVIILQVGEQKFYTTKATLEGSKMLKAMVSHRWNASKDGEKTFFLDADPEAFKHILCFLRHGVYPLCYNSASGHDYYLYTVIYKLADYLQITELAAWLHGKKYLEAIKVTTRASVSEGEDALFATDESNVKMQYHPSWRIVKKYVCPRGIRNHYDNPQGCGKACRAALGDEDDEYEDCTVLSILSVAEKVFYDQKLCTHGD